MGYFYYMNKLIPLFLTILTFISCTAQIEGFLEADSSAAMSVSATIEPRMALLLRTLGLTQGQTGGQVIDGPSIALSMSRAPGIASIMLRNTAPAAVEGNVRISSVNDFLSVANGSGFITFDQSQSGGRCEININRDTSPVIFQALSQEVSDYLNALMAPAATGEEMSKLDYLELVAIFYNRTISDEIASSRIRVSMTFPGNVTSVRGGTFNGRRANFDIPLLDLLVLETPLTYEVRWD